MIIKTGNKTHDDARLAAEMTRQATVMPDASQSAIRNAEIAFYRSIITRARTNGVPMPESACALAK